MVLLVYGAVSAYGAVVVTVFVVLVLPHLTRSSEALGSGSRVLVFAPAVLAFNLFASRTPPSQPCAGPG